MDYKYKLSVSLCIKNEAKYIKEFIKHYIKQGVDHFYIINNNSSDNIHETIKNSPYKNLITLINDNRDMNILKNNDGSFGHKKLLDENLYEIVKKETEWLINVDADEFMYGKNGHTIKSYLLTINKSIGCIYVIWNIINPVKDIQNNITNYFSIKNNVKRLNYDLINKLSASIIHANDFGKSIVRTSMLMDNTKLWLHKMIVNGETISNYAINSSKYDNKNNIEYSEENFKKLNITLNHYAIRNSEDYIKKENQINNVSHKNGFILGLFEMLNLNEEYFIIDDYINNF